MSLLRVTDVAKRLSISRARVYTLAQTGVLPLGVVVHVGRQLRFDGDALDQWIAAGGETLPGGWRREPKATTDAGAGDELARVRRERAKSCTTST